MQRSADTAAVLGDNVEKLQSNEEVPRIEYHTVKASTHLIAY